MGKVSLVSGVLRMHVDLVGSKDKFTDKLDIDL